MPPGRWRAWPTRPRCRRCAGRWRTLTRPWARRAAAGPDVGAAAARGLALRRAREAAPALVRLLDSPGPPARLAAAQALAHCGTSDTLSALWEALERQPDRFLEHALIHAAHRLADA